MTTIHKSGLLALRDGRLLLCRKRTGTPLLILPGGKREPGETAEQCLRRELQEEIAGATVGALQHVGTYRDVAAGEQNRMIEIELFSGELVGEPRAQAEIAALVWFGAGDDPATLAPSIARRILPDLRRRHIISWD
jgi:ADP-ribose pyrophosphatase YjhB (NUDIX family)